MAENSAGSPVFAGRYRFQSVGSDWDTGRSGFTHLVFDIQKERLGVMKRAELKSQQAVDNLKNEVAALLDLRGKGVPELYDTGETEYGAKKYFYMVIEYIDGIRIEKNLDTLTASERANILFQFFGVLTIAHRMGILNGDIDIKHLFWRRDKKQLVIIDWGNARLNIDPKNKSEFAFDLARAAEITHTLVLRKGRVPVSGALTLPKDTSLLPGLAPVPPEFRTLCKWAPRTPSSRIQTPLSALDLYEATKKWLKGVPYKPIKQANWIARLIFLLILAGVAYLGITQRSLIQGLLSLTATANSSPSTTIPPISTTVIEPSETITPTSVAPRNTPALEPTLTSTETATETPTSTVTVPVTPSPGIYTNIIVDSASADFKVSNCWANNTQGTDGFSIRKSDGNMQFRVSDGLPTTSLVQTDFSACISDLTGIQAISLNALVNKLEIARIVEEKTEDGREFGFFVENSIGQRREYTIWFDKSYKLLVRIRETGQEPVNQEVIVLNEGSLEKFGNFPNQAVKFPIQIFLELNNKGLDVLYLKEGSEKLVAINALELAPAQMIVIDQATRPTFGDITRIGLVGYGGETTIVIWPLAIFSEIKP